MKNHDLKLFRDLLPGDTFYIENDENIMRVKLESGMSAVVDRQIPTSNSEKVWHRNGEARTFASDIEKACGDIQVLTNGIVEKALRIIRRQEVPATEEKPAKDQVEEKS